MADRIHEGGPQGPGLLPGELACVSRNSTSVREWVAYPRNSQGERQAIACTEPAPRVPRRGRTVQNLREVEL